MAASLESIQSVLPQHGQEHLLAFYDELDSAQRAGLLEQIEQIDLGLIEGLIRAHIFAVPDLQLPGNLAPAGMLPTTPKDRETIERYSLARRRGEELIAAGKVAAMVVAGGDGTRLGVSGPKGCLSATPVKRKPLFQVFAEQVLATQRRYRAVVPWYVMTSPSNDAAVRAFFQADNNWGLKSSDVFFFAQGLMPAISLDGKILLAEKDRIAWNPDGHGGSLTALRRCGALEDMARRGVEYISYFQVDNPLVRCIDPLFIGLHEQAGAQVSAKALPKREPMEKLGNFCLVDGKVMIIEYSDLPEDLARATRPDGTLLFSAGSIAIHVFSRRFVERLTSGGSCRLPFHRAIRKVPCLDESGRKLQPEKANAAKFEMFVFDALPLAEKVVLLQTLRAEEFSPVKNASGEDSLATCLRDQVRRAATWLEAAGVRAPRDASGQIAASIEISPLLALDAEELARKIKPGLSIRAGEELYLE